MKLLVSTILFVILFFNACSTKQEVVVYNNNQKTVQEKSSPTLYEEKEFVHDIQGEDLTTEPKNIALVYATNTIGKYSIEAVNVVTSYLSMKKLHYNFASFDMEDESLENLNEVLQRIKEQNIDKVIFLITDTYLNQFLQNNSLSQLNIFFPIINKESLLEQNKISSNILFGGIDYPKQFDMIIKSIDKDMPIYEIYDDRSLSLSLHEQIEKNYPQISSISMYGKNPNYDRVLAKVKDLNGSSIILNTSIIKSSIILSQLRANDIYPARVYSAQLNYTPLLFALTQSDDRKNLYLINSIGKVPKNIASRCVLAQNDILYNWVNYSTLIGLEYLLYPREIVFNNQISENQILYNNQLIKVNNNQFLNMNSIE